MIELQHLKYFRKVAELEHITQAAFELRVAQPALSKTMHQIESKLGVPLFKRSNRKIFLNENGEILLKYADIVDTYLRELKDALEQNQEKQDAKINILMKISSVLLPEMLQQFCAKYPSAEIQLLVYNRNIDEQNFKSDFIIASSTPESANMSYIPLLDEEMVMAVPASYPLVGKRVSLDTFSNEKFICMPPSYYFHHKFNKACRIAGFTPNIIVESSDNYTISAMISAHMGIAMVPEFSWGYQTDPCIGFVYLKQPVPKNQILLIWKNSTLLSEKCLRFKEFAASFF